MEGADDEAEPSGPLLRVTLHATDEQRRALSWPNAAARLAQDGIHIAAAFVESKSIDVYVEPPAGRTKSDLGAAVAAAVGLDEYELANASPLTPDAARPRDPFATPDPSLEYLRPAPITRMWVHPGGETLRVEIRHRPDEALHSIELSERDDEVVVRIVVGCAKDSPGMHIASLRTQLSRVPVALRRPLGTRRLTARQPPR